jgi:hypothetical protein
MPAHYVQNIHKAGRIITALPVCAVLFTHLGCCGTNPQDVVSRASAFSPEVPMVPSTAAGGHEPSAAPPSDVRDVLAELETAPAWTSITDDVRRTTLMRSLEAVASHGPDTIRSAARLYVAERKQSVPSHFARASNIYVLNRLLFDVPPKGHAFGAWFGSPPNSPMWPIAMTPSGPMLVGHFQGYRGDPYDAIAEFDSFRQYYGLRRGLATTLFGDERPDAQAMSRAALTTTASSP